MGKERALAWCHDLFLVGGAKDPEGQEDQGEEGEGQGEGEGAESEPLTQREEAESSSEEARPFVYCLWALDKGRHRIIFGIAIAIAACMYTCIYTHIPVASFAGAGVPPPHGMSLTM